MKSVWENISALTVVLSWDDLSTIERYREAFQNFGISELDFLVIFPTKELKEKFDFEGVTSICPKDLNWFKKVKTEALKTFFSQTHSAVFFVGTPDEKYRKLFKKMKASLRIGVNCELKTNRLNFSTQKENPSEIVYFVKQNLEKIYE